MDSRLQWMPATLESLRQQMEADELETLPVRAQRPFEPTLYRLTKHTRAALSPPPPLTAQVPSLLNGMARHAASRKALEPVEALVHSLWEQAQKHAGDGLSHYREEADRLVEAAREQAQRSRREAEDALQREAAINEHWLQAQTRLQEHSALIARLEAAQQAAEQRENELNQRLAAAERQAGEARQSLRDEQAQHQTALKARDEHWSEQLKQEEQRHEAAEARLMALLDEARQERQRSEKNQQQRIDALEKRLAEADQDRQATRRALSEEQASHRETQWSLNKAKDALSESERRVRQYADDRAENDKVVAQLRERLQDAEARLARVNLPPFVY